MTTNRKLKHQNHPGGNRLRDAIGPQTSKASLASYKATWPRERNPYVKEIKSKPYKKPDAVGMHKGIKDIQTNYFEDLKNPSKVWQRGFGKKTRVATETGRIKEEQMQNYPKNRKRVVQNVHKVGTQSGLSKKTKAVDYRKIKPRRLWETYK